MHTPRDPDFWSWFAGFWEGEGNARVFRHKSRSSRTVVVSIGQATRAPLDYILDQIGIGGTSFYDNGHKGIWKWSVATRREVIHLIEEMLPRIRFRQGMLRAVLEHARSVEHEGVRARWTTEEVDLLRRLYPLARREELVMSLKHSWGSIGNKARSLGLRYGYGRARLGKRRDSVPRYSSSRAGVGRGVKHDRKRHGESESKGG